MKRIIFLLAAACCSFALSAQKIPHMLELVQVGDGDDDVICEVVNIPQEDQNHYWLNVGNLGIGNEIFQVVVDPISNLFIPLGDTLSDAMAKLEEMQELFKGEPGTSLFAEGCLTALFPDGNLEQVKVTYYKPLLTRKLEFSVQREDILRAGYITRANFNSLINSLKIYRKIHPDE